MIAKLPGNFWLIRSLRRIGHRRIPERRPKVLVIGVGGAGGNALNNMIRGDLRGVEFCAVNTDVQALEQSLARRKVQIGPRATRGLGAGARVGIGQVAAEESLDAIRALVRGNDMVFVTAGMGGGTGTGAAPVIADVARRSGILTVGVVTRPFDFEGEHRQSLALGGVADMEAATDTLLVIPNQNLFQVADAQTTLLDAFRMADDVLHAGVRGVTDLMAEPGLVNLDFADVRTVMKNMGQATMGTGEAEGDDRAVIAAAAAMSNPLIEQGSMRGARGVLVNVTGGADLTLFDVNAAVDRVRREAAPGANIIFGSTFNKRLQGRIRISVVATGIGNIAAEIVEPQFRSLGDVDPDSAGVARMALPTSAAAPTLSPLNRMHKRPGLIGGALGLAVIARIGAGGLSLVGGEADRSDAMTTSHEPSGGIGHADVSTTAGTEDAVAAATLQARLQDEPVSLAESGTSEAAPSSPARTMANAPEEMPASRPWRPKARTTWATPTAAEQG